MLARMSSTRREAVGKALRLVDHALQQKRRPVAAFEKVEDGDGIAGLYDQCALGTMFDVDDPDRRGHDRHSLGQVFAGRVCRAQGYFVNLDRNRRWLVAERELSRQRKREAWLRSDPVAKLPRTDRKLCALVSGRDMPHRIIHRRSSWCCSWRRSLSVSSWMFAPSIVITCPQNDSA